MTDTPTPGPLLSDEEAAAMMTDIRNPDPLAQANRIIGSKDEASPRAWQAFLAYREAREQQIAALETQLVRCRATYDREIDDREKAESRVAALTEEVERLRRIRAQMIEASGVRVQLDGAEILALRSRVAALVEALRKTQTGLCFWGCQPDFHRIECKDARAALRAMEEE